MERLIRPALPVMVLLAATVADAEVREVPASVQQGTGQFPNRGMKWKT